MKKLFFHLLFCFVFVIVNSVWGGTVGDINSDGAVGLPEAIYALQVASGISSTSIEPVISNVDLAEYFFVTNGEYLYQKTVYPWSYQPTVSTVLYYCGSEMVNGVNMLTIEESGVGKSYYEVNSSGIVCAGYPSDMAATPSTTWVTPPIIRGTRNMTKGDIFTNFFLPVDLSSASSYQSLFYEEDVFVGIEDVTVPAGTFPNCLKLLRKDFLYISVDYYAKNVGMVKRITTFAGSSPTFVTPNIMELTFARIGDTTYPDNALCLGSGTWSKTIDGTPSGSGNFSLPIFLQNGKALGQVILTDYYMPSDLVISIVSDDSVQFVADPAIYGDNPPDCNITVSNGTISGYVVEPQSATAHHNGTTEPVTPPVIIITLTGSCSG